MSKTLSPVIKIAKYTIGDEVRQKSFIVMFVICALFIFLARGCYQGDYNVNGQEVEAGNVIIMVSKIIFHIVAAGVMFLAGLLAMRIFRRDRDDGTQSSILSKPITRGQYVTGKIIGLWFLLIVFMLVLHGIVFTITSVKLGIVMPEYLIASLICSLNLLFIVVAMLLLSLLMPDIAAFLCVLVIGIVGWVSEGIFAVSHSPMGQAMMQHHNQSDMTLWQIIYYLWPKISGVQYFASSLISAEGFDYLAALYPLANILCYCMVLGALLFWRFRKEDIT